MSNDANVVITGMGLATPLGHDIDTVWSRLAGGETALKLQEPLKRGAALIEDFEPREHVSAPRVLRMTNGSTIWALAAARRAWQHAGFEAGSPIEPTRFGIYVGSGESEMRPEHFFPGLEESVDAQGKFNLDTFAEKGLEAIDPYLALLSLANNALCYISINHQLMGPNNTYVKSSVSSTHALGEAYWTIRHGYADAMMVAGVDEMSDTLAMVGYDAIGQLSKADKDIATAMRPFDRRRDGFLPGSGAGALVLEREDVAVKRGAKILGRVLGYGQTTDAHDLLSPPADGGELTRAIEEALADASLGADKLDFIIAAGEATQAGDASEAAAIARAAAGALRRTPITALKPLTGHLGAASGTVDAISALLMMQHGKVLPIPNLQEPAADLHFIAGAPHAAKLAVGMHVARGIGGQNAVLVIGGA